MAMPENRHGTCSTIVVMAPRERRAEAARPNTGRFTAPALQSTDGEDRLLGSTGIDARARHTDRSRQLSPHKR